MIIPVHWRFFCWNKLPPSNHASFVPSNHCGQTVAMCWYQRNVCGGGLESLNLFVCLSYPSLDLSEPQRYAAVALLILYLSINSSLHLSTYQSDGDVGLSVHHFVPDWNLNNCWMDCHENLYRYSSSPEDESYWLWWFSDFLASATSRSCMSTSTLWIGTKFWTDIYSSRTINLNDFGDPWPVL